MSDLGPFDLARLSVEFVDGRLQRGEISPLTAVAHRSQLLLFARWLGRVPVNEVTMKHVETYFAQLHVERTTKRYRLSTLRVFFAWLVRQELCPSNPTDGVCPAKPPRYLPRPLSAEQVTKALLACAGPRDRLCVVLGAQQGLRVSEMAALQVGDLDLDFRVMRVFGKGAKERLLPITDETHEALTDYLLMVGHSSGPLLRSESSPKKGLGSHYVGCIIKEILTRAGLSASAHHLRHSAATHTLRSGASIRVVQAMLGHVSLSSTERYLGFSDVEDLRRAMAGRRYGRCRDRTTA